MKIVPDSYLFAVEAQQPEQLHSAQINASKFGDNPALKSASETFGYGWEKLGAIRELRNNPNPEFTPAKHDRTVKEAVDAFDRDFGPRLDAARAKLKAEKSRVEAQLEKAANLKPVEKFTSAILGTFSGLNEQERQQTLAELIEAGDGPTLASLLEAPAFVTGIKAEQRETIKRQLFGKVDATALALRGGIETALLKVEQASIATIYYSIELRKGTDRFDERVKEAAERAAKANIGFAA